MLIANDFDRNFFKQPCYRLKPTVTVSDWDEFDQLTRRDAIFADLKSSASDLKTAGDALQHAFRKICTQVELTHSLKQVVRIESVIFSDSLELTVGQRRAHAEHFHTSRYHQDPLIAGSIANDLYTAWITNSLSGKKRVAAVGLNFCTFVDEEGLRRIDLLSVLERGRGYARRLLDALTYNAKLHNLREVVVTTEVENELALKAYRAAGFAIRTFNSVFHFRG